MTKDKPRTLKIYHSCEAPDAPVLLRFKAGTHTLYHPFLDPHASAPLVWIPKRKGAAQQVRRCLKPDCETCAATEDVGDLTLEVAKVHGIRGVALKPSTRARTVGERIGDGIVRGRWMFGGGVLGVGEVGGVVSRRVDWENFGGGDGSGQVGRWLEGLPEEFEGWESGEVSEETTVGSEVDRLVVEGEGRLDDSLPVGERLRDCFARRDGLERRFAEAARSQTRARQAEWRNFLESSAAAPWTMPAPPPPNVTAWNGSFATTRPAYPLQSRPQRPFGSNTRHYTKPGTHPHRFDLATNPTLTGLPPDTTASKPPRLSLTELHQPHTPLPFVPSGTPEANLQYYINDLDAYMSARGFPSARHQIPPPPAPLPGVGNKPPSGIGVATRSAAHQAVNHAAAAPPPFAHKLGAGPRPGARPGTNLTQRTPGPAQPVLPSASSVLGTKRAHEDAGLVAQERRKKTCRIELQSDA